MRLQVHPFWNVNLAGDRASVLDGSPRKQIYPDEQEKRDNEGSSDGAWIDLIQI